MIASQAKLRIPMRGYENSTRLLDLTQMQLRIPMRGYEIRKKVKEIAASVVTNPHAGL